MEILSRAVGPAATNVYVLGDPSTREALAVDTARPCVAWLTALLAERGWSLRLVVSSHRHWDHIGDNAEVTATTGAALAVHALDRHGLEAPPATAPFPIPPSVPALELAEGGVIRFGELQLEVLHTPGHTEGSVCLFAREAGVLLSGDTLFAGGWGRIDLPGGSADQMVESLRRLARLDDVVRFLPGHGPASTIGRERSWLDLVSRSGRLFA